MVSDSPAPLGAAYRRALNLPQPLLLRTDAAGCPIAVQRAGRWVGIAAVQDRWRIDEDWWRQEVSRCYYHLILEDGRLLTVFQDLMGQGWYQQSYL